MHSHDVLPDADQACRAFASTTLAAAARDLGWAASCSSACPWTMARRARSPSPFGAAPRWRLQSWSRALVAIYTNCSYLTLLLLFLKLQLGLQLQVPFLQLNDPMFSSVSSLKFGKGTIPCCACTLSWSIRTLLLCTPLGRARAYPQTLNPTLDPQPLSPKPVTEATRFSERFPQILSHSKP